MSAEAPPIACDLTAIPEDERDRHQTVTETVFEAIHEVREVKNGYAFQLPTETELITKAATFIAGERLCCPFFNFTLEVTPDHGPVWLKLTGRDGVKAYVEDTVLSHWEEENVLQTAD